LLLHWELRAAMTKLDVAIISQRAGKKYPDTSPRIIADNGPAGYQTHEIPPYNDRPLPGLNERTPSVRALPTGSTVAA
jgi:hypothetical protein